MNSEKIAEELVRIAEDLSSGSFSEESGKSGASLTAGPYAKGPYTTQQGRNDRKLRALEEAANEAQETLNFKYDIGFPGAIRQAERALKRALKELSDYKDSTMTASSRLVKLARELVAGNMTYALLKIKPGKRGKFEVKSKDVSFPFYVHVWFDADVATDDFGNHSESSGEWQVIFSDKEDWRGGKEMARETFRYVESKMRDRVAARAAGWIKDTVRKIERRYR